MVTVKCANCGKELLRSQYRIDRASNQFCCSKCRQNWMTMITGKDHPLYKHEERICPHCRNVFLVRPSEKKKYCSLDCYAEHKKNRRNCVICGKEVHRKGSKYCSRECMGIDRQNRTEKTCSICGRKFTRRPCEDNGDRSVCSRDCANKLKTGDFRITDSELKKYLLHLNKTLGRIPDLNDLKNEMQRSPEIALHWSLFVRRGGLRYWQKKLFGKTTYRFVWEDKCIEFFNQVLNYPEFQAQKTFPWLKRFKSGMKRAGSLRVDVFYPEYNLCVEFDGAGHFQEIDWKKGGTETLLEVQKRDELKNKLIQQHGLKLIRFKYDEPLTREHIIKKLGEVNIDFI